MAETNTDGKQKLLQDDGTLYIHSQGHIQFKKWMQVCVLFHVIVYFCTNLGFFIVDESRSRGQHLHSYNYICIYTPQKY